MVEIQSTWCAQIINNLKQTVVAQGHEVRGQLVAIDVCL